MTPLLITVFSMHPWHAHAHTPMPAHTLLPRTPSLLPFLQAYYPRLLATAQELYSELAAL